MNEPALHLAMRELQRHFTDPRVPGGMVVVGLLLGIAGPFGTLALLDLVPRIVYWLAIVFLTYAIGYGLGALLGPPLMRRLGRPALMVLALGIVEGPAATVTVLGINAIAFGTDNLTAGSALALLVNCTLIAIGINTLWALVAPWWRDEPSSPAGDGAADAPPAILERLPLPQRGDLLSLSVSDHYVEIVTERGKGLVLMRLGDAIRETAPVAGLQIHRSHWVALDAVRRGLRADGKLWLELADGRRLPVSRSYAAAVRDAGLVT